MMRLFCLALMLFGLGSCGENDTPTLTTIRDGNCGEIVLTGNSLRAADAAQARNASICFMQAFQNCASTTLTIREPNNVTRQFSITRNGAPVRCAKHSKPMPMPHPPLWIAKRRASKITRSSLKDVHISVILH